MTTKIQVDCVRMLQSENGLGWTKNPTTGRYETDLFGVDYELEKRVRNRKDETHDTGWYLYSKGVAGGFFGEWCARKIYEAVDAASKMIVKADLRTEGYERES